MIKVELGQGFAQHFVNFPDEDKSKIRNFVSHVSKNGLEGLEGRNKSSMDVSRHDGLFSVKIEYAKKYNLWHYHIGIPKYDKETKNGKTSDYVLHYIKGESHIKIVSLDNHPMNILEINELD